MCTVQLVGIITTGKCQNQSVLIKFLNRNRDCSLGTCLDPNLGPVEGGWGRVEKSSKVLRRGASRLCYDLKQEGSYRK